MPTSRRYDYLDDDLNDAIETMSVPMVRAIDLYLNDAEYHAEVYRAAAEMALTLGAPMNKCINVALMVRAHQDGAPCVGSIFTYPDVDDSGAEDREDRMKWWMEREDAWEEEEQP